MDIFATNKPEYTESIENCIQTLEKYPNCSIQFFCKNKTGKSITFECFTIPEFLQEITKLGTEYFEAYFYTLPF